jgi:two-component system chemotaxis response regulator CheB
LNQHSKLAAAHATDGEVIEPGRIYVAPPDHHLLVADGRLELDHGPRENYTRPAIDPLFRSAARAYGEDAIGVILTGELNDGTAGLYEIKKAGGIAIVQSPADAEWPSMPRSAHENVPTDYCLPLSKIAEVLVRLSREERQTIPSSRAKRGAIAMSDEEHPLRRPVAQTCPECGGAMSEQAVGKLTQFRCHIGHVMTAEVLAAAQRDSLEQHLSSAMRTLNERLGLCREMSQKCSLLGNLEGKQRWTAAAKEAQGRVDLVRELVEIEWTHPEAC